MCWLWFLGGTREGWPSQTTEPNHKFLITFKTFKVKMSEQESSDDSHISDDSPSS